MLYDTGNEPDPSQVPLSVTRVASGAPAQMPRPAAGLEQTPRES